MDYRTSKYEGLKFEHGKAVSVSDALTVEEALQIDINSIPFTVIMRTPGNEKELVRGLLYTEDLYKGKEDIEITVKKKNDLGHITEINIRIDESQLGKGYLNTRSMLSVSSCGICGKRELGDLTVRGKKLSLKDFITPSNLVDMFKSMEEAQVTFKTTGGSHSATAFSLKGKLLTLMEDIGRHNAVDKAIGSLLMKKELRLAKAMLVSGRVSYEIVTKVFMAKIPVLAAVSAPSTLAVDYAKELGITLFAFTRDGKTTCYSHPERIQKLKA